MFDVQIVIRDTSLLGEEYFATFASGWEIDELLDALNTSGATAASSRSSAPAGRGRMTHRSRLLKTNLKHAYMPMGKD